MKTIKLSLTLLSLILFFGCSTSSDSNGNSTTTVVPLAPNNLTGTLVNNQVVLTWTDNSTNETGFKIERMIGTGSWSEIGSVAPEVTPASVQVTIFVATDPISGATYTYRVYSFNSVGNSLSYSNSFLITIPVTVTDSDGNTYQTVTICNQIWIKTTLNVSKYRNGDVIPQVTDPAVWANLTTGAWCYYNNNSANGITYGKLYNWYAVNDTRGLAPTGWHVPTDAEWTYLTDCLGGGSVAGGKMKATGTGLWQSPNAAATNESGFTGLPAGYRGNNGTFYSIGFNGYWWSSSENNITAAWTRNLNFSNGNAYRDNPYKQYGLSVRCVKD